MQGGGGRHPGGCSKAESRSTTATMDKSANGHPCDFTGSTCSIMRRGATLGCDASRVVGGLFFNTQALGRGVVAHVTQLCSSWESMQYTPVCEWCHSVVIHRCVVYCSVVVAEAREDAARANPHPRQQRWTNLQMARLTPHRNAIYHTPV